MTKTLSIDKAGRVVIPQPIRQMFGWNAGAVLKIEVTAQSVVLTPEEQEPALVCRNGVWVHTGKAPPEVFLNAIAEAREERAEAVWRSSL